MNAPAPRSPACATPGDIRGAAVVFGSTGGRLGGIDRRKKQIDEASGVTGCARSLMSRAGVPSEHAERCLGQIPGVEGIYDNFASPIEVRAHGDPEIHEQELPDGGRERESPTGHRRTI